MLNRAEASERFAIGAEGEVIVGRTAGILLGPVSGLIGVFDERRILPKAGVAVIVAGGENVAVGADGDGADLVDEVACGATRVCRFEFHRQKGRWADCLLEYRIGR